MIDLSHDVSDIKRSLYMSRSRQETVQNRLIRRLSTPRGSYKIHPEYGYDVISLVGSSAVSDSSRLSSEIKNEVLKDPDVLKAKVSVTLLDRTLTADIQYTLRDLDETVQSLTITLENITL